MNEQHPNLIPVRCQVWGELKALAQEMLESARKYAVNSKEEYSTTEAEVYERVREIKEEDRLWMFKAGISRVALVRGQIISLCCTLETFETPPIYRLSMVQILGPGSMGSVPDRDADIIAASFGKMEKVVNPSGIEYAKHYTMAFVPTPECN